MNSKLSLLVILFVLSACGVKSDPIPPKDSAYPSYDAKFMKAKPTPTPTATPAQ